MFRMSKKALLACLLVMTMLLSSCALVVKDQAVDDATPIVKVGDKVFTKVEVKQMVEVYLSQLAQNYAQNYGQSLDTTDASVVASAQQTVVDDLVEQTVVEMKGAELGASPLTEEELADVEEEYQMYYSVIEGVIGEHEHAEGEEDQHVAEVEYFVAYYFGVTREALQNQKMVEKLQEIVTADVQVTEDDIVAYYNDRVASSQSNYAKAPTGYGSAVNNGNQVFYRPAGYRMVKNLLIQYSDEYKTAISGLESKASAQRSTASSKLQLINSYENVALDEMMAKVTVTVEEAPAEATTTDLTTLSDLEKASLLELTCVVVDTFEATDDEQQQTLQTAVKDYMAANALADAYTARAEALTEQAYASIDAEADEALARLDAGEDWDAVMAAYTDDPGMKEGRETAVTGYAVCEGFTSFDSAFVDAAMAMENVGDHTGKVRGASNGYYILQYTSAVEEGAVPLDEVREQIEKEALNSKKNEVYEAKKAQWIAESGAVIDLNALRN